MTRIWLTLAVLMLAAGMVLAGDKDEAQMNSKSSDKGSAMQTMTFTSIPFKTITGDETNLDHYKGKVILIVNTASKCGYTPQYEGLESLYKKYEDSGLVIIGFPANNFGGQEPGTNEQIIQFCKATYDVTFPMMSKISVKGDDIHPLYKYLTQESKLPGEITWNFNKFLIDRDGNVAARYDSKVTPESDELVGKITALLHQKG